MLSLDQKATAEFRVGDLFDSHLGVNLSQGDLLDHGEYPVVAAVTENNGVRGYVDQAVPGKTFSHCLTVACRGKSGTTYWQPWDFVLGNNAIALIPKNGELTRYQGNFLASHIEKLGYGDSYSNYITRSGILEDVLTLPVTDFGEPDWDWMEQYIRQIEQRHLDAIAQHNAREQQLLAAIYGDRVDTEPVAHGYAEVRIGDVFDAITKTAVTKDFLKSDVQTDVFSLPGISATTENWSVGYYLVPEEHDPVEHVISVTADGIHCGYASYQSKPVGLVHAAYLLRFKDHSAGSRAHIYAVAALNKNNAEKYNYTNKAGWGRLSNDTITLPVTLSGDIDFDFMEQYVAYIEQREIDRRAVRAAQEQRVLSLLV